MPSDGGMAVGVWCFRNLVVGGRELNLGNGLGFGLRNEFSLGLGC